MKIFAMLIAIVLFLPATAQKRTRTEGPVMPVITEGIIYSLPRTGIRVIIQARQTTFVPGPYAAFADQLLGIRDVKMQPNTLWEIEDVKFETYAEPDPSHAYKATGGAAFLQLTSSGILTGINSASEPAPYATTFSNSFALLNKAQGLTFNTLIDNPGLTGRTAADQRAVQAANRILRARSVRFDIVAGQLDEFHPDGGAYQQSMQELYKMEYELLSLFTGKSATESYTFSFDYMPQSSVRGEVIFRFDENRGFLPKTDLSGKPVMIDVERDEELASNLAAVKGEPGLQYGPGRVYYRQPGLADIRISRELTVIGTGRATIAQFGEVMPLPGELLDGTYSIDFHPETGAIKTITKK
jgi:hypothetical protein